MKPEHEQYILKNIGHKPAEAIAKDLGLKERNVNRFLEKQKSKERAAGPRNETIAPVKKKIVLLSVFLIVVLGFTVYGNSINGEFIWDDNLLIKENIYIKDWSYIPKIFSEDVGSGSGIEYHFYRPLQMVTYMVDYSLWKLDVKGYHLTNIVLHILAALGVYCLFNFIFKDNLLSLLTAIFFVVHPVHTEVVAYISGRADSLALLFMLSCFLFYVKQLSSNNAGLYILMLLSYALALLSKESSLILPVLLLLYHYSFKERVKGKGFFSILGLALAYVLLRTTVLKDLMSRAPCTTTLSERFPGFFAAATNYVRLLFFPFDLHMEYGKKLFHWGDLEVILGAGILSMMLIYAFRKRKENKIVFFSLLWFLIALAPVSNLYPINAYMAEHWLYLPSVGVFLILAGGVNGLRKIRGVGFFIVIIAIGLSAFYSYLTIKNNRYWKTPLVFYERLVKYAPDSTKVHVELGLIYNSIGRKREAEAMLKKAIKINPDYAEAYNSLGATYDLMGKKEEALAMFKKAIKIKPDFARAHNNLSIFYFYQKQYKLAIEYCDKAKALGFVNPVFVEALKPYRK